MAKLAAHPRSRQLTAIFLTALEAEGYLMGIGHHQAVQELLERLPADTPEAVLGDGLVALLATSKTDQAHYRQLFVRAQAQVAAMAGPAAVGNQETARAAKPEKQRLIWRLLGLAGLLLIPLLAWIIVPPQEVDLSDHEREMPAYAGQRTFISGVDSLKELGAISGYELPAYGAADGPKIGRVDTAGTRLFYKANPYDSTATEDAFTVVLKGTDKRYGRLNFRVYVKQDPARTPVPVVDEKAGRDSVVIPPLEPDYDPIKPLPHPRTLADLAVAEPAGFGWADLKYYGWWPGLGLLFGIFIMGIYFWLKYRREKDVRLIAQQDKLSGAPHFWRIEIPDLHTAIDWGEHYPSLLRQLRRRREDDHRELDVKRTIQRTIEKGGLPSFSYRSATRPAEYLLLIDRGIDGNHYTHLFDQLYEQLRAEEVLIERYFYDGDPRQLYQDDRAKLVSLTSLQRRFADSRLLMVGSGDRLLNPATGKITKWAGRQFATWKSRSLLTPLPPGEWGREEKRLAQFFALLPATMQGLRLLVERTNDGDTGESAVDFRQLIIEADERPVEFNDTLLGTLLDHFSVPEIQWIAACALYPTLHWDLTLFFGRTVGEAKGVSLLTSRNLLSLARIPWFTNGSIPPAARTELTRWLRKTDPALDQTLRRALNGVLEQYAPAPEGSAARQELDFFHLQNEWLLAFDAPKRRAKLSEQLAKEIAADKVPDVTVAQVLEGEMPEGAIPLPQSFNKQLCPEGLPGLGYKPELWRLLPALLFLIPTILFGWWFQPTYGGSDDDCNAKVWSVRDTVSYGIDTTIQIQICDKLDSLTLAEYVWQARIAAAKRVEDLDTLPVRFQTVAMFAEGEAMSLVYVPTPALSRFLAEMARDSLEEEYRENVGAMLWNRGVSFKDSTNWFSDEPCRFLLKADSLILLTEAQLLAVESACAFSTPARPPVPVSNIENTLPPAIEVIEDTLRLADSRTIDATPVVIEQDTIKATEVSPKKDSIVAEPSPEPLSWTRKNLPDIVYVTADGKGDGSTWKNATGSLRDALHSAYAGDQVWVAKGTYKPSLVGNRSTSFELKGGVSLYGGFEGTESSTDARNEDARTILSGDIGSFDAKSDNSYTVLSVLGSEFIADGFVVERGQARNFMQGFSVGNAGGAIFLSGVSGTFNNVRFKENVAHNGGAVYIGNADNADLLFTNCSFEDNTADFMGGVVYLNGGGESGGSPQFLDCVFERNGADYGGVAAINHGEGEVVCTFLRSEFRFNVARSNGSYIYIMSKEGEKPQQIVSECIFEDNRSILGDDLGYMFGINIPKPAMIQIPAGTFQMGDNFGEGEKRERPVHTVTLSAFSLGQNEVTFEEYDLYAEKIEGIEKPKDRDWGRARRPVINVSWWDAVKYCNWLSEQHGYTPVYTINEDAEEITANWKANGYRLPTEAEWEYAASVRRDGTKVRFGNGRGTLRAEQANFNASYVKPYSVAGANREQTLPVGSFLGNDRNLNDLSGNVYEWCWDWYGDYLKGVSPNPYGASEGAFRVIRGGSWYNSPGNCRAADRGFDAQTGRFSYLGFRLARSL